MRQVQQLGWAAQRNLDLQEGWEMTQEHLQHSGINVDGVVKQIRRRLEHVRGTAVLPVSMRRFVIASQSRDGHASSIPFICKAGIYSPGVLLSDGLCKE